MHTFIHTWVSAMLAGLGHHAGLRQPPEPSTVSHNIITPLQWSSAVIGMGQTTLHSSSEELGMPQEHMYLPLQMLPTNDNCWTNEYVKGKLRPLMTWEFQIMPDSMFRGFSFLLPLLIWALPLGEHTARWGIALNQSRTQRITLHRYL